MTEFGKFSLLAIGGTCLVLLLSAFPILHFFDQDVLIAVIAGSLVGLVNITVAFLFNKRAFLVEKEKLLKVFFSGMILRFFIIVVIFLIVAGFSTLNLLAFSLSVIAFYLVLQVYELNYLNAQLSKRKKHPDVF